VGGQDASQGVTSRSPKTAQFCHSVSVDPERWLRHSCKFGCRTYQEVQGEVRDGRCFRHKTGNFESCGDKVVGTVMEGENGGWEWRGLGEYLSAAEVELGKDEKSRIRSSGCPVFDTNGDLRKAL